MYNIVARLSRNVDVRDRYVWYLHPHYIYCARCMQSSLCDKIRALDMSRLSCKPFTFSISFDTRTGRKTESEARTKCDAWRTIAVLHHPSPFNASTTRCAQTHSHVSTCKHKYTHRTLKGTDRLKHIHINVQICAGVISTHAQARRVRASIYRRMSSSLVSSWVCLARTRDLLPLPPLART